MHVRVDKSSEDIMTVGPLAAMSNFVTDELLYCNFKMLDKLSLFQALKNMSKAQVSEF